MKIFIYRETHPVHFSLNIGYEKEGLIVAENIESAKEILFQACFNGKGTHNFDSGGDEYFPSILDYYGQEGRKRWEDYCRELFFERNWYVWHSEPPLVLLQIFFIFC